MKIRLVALLAILATGLCLAGPATPAQSAVPGIKQTVAFKRLKNYVTFLQSKRTVPVNSTRRQTYKTTLTSRRKNANSTVLALYSRTLLKISREDDVKQRRDIKKIRQNQKAQVQSLNAKMAVRLSALQDNENAAQARIYASYNVQINPLANKRDRFKRQLAKTANPTKRAQLTRKINKLQVQINALVSDRTTDLNNLQNQFNLKAKNIRNKFGQQIANVKANAQQQIQQERNAWRQTFRTQIQAAKTRRDAQKDIVSSQAERGFSFIQQMPPVDA
jgi:hypothetical protein